MQASLAKEAPSYFGAREHGNQDRELLDHEDVRTTRRSYRRSRVQKIRPLRQKYLPRPFLFTTASRKKQREC